MISPLTIAASDHPIKSVTVFKSFKAEVVRTFALSLNAGPTKVVIKGLPSTIDTQTIRVSGLGNARLLDLVCTISTDKASTYSPDSSSEIIRLLTSKKHVLESEKRVRDHEAELIVNYGKSLTGEHVNPSQMSQFLENFVDRARRNLDVINEIEEKIIELERQIERETSKGLVKKGDARGEVVVVLGTDDKAVINLKLTYIVSHVHWKPSYELHATTENGKPSSSVRLHYRARVTQSTGEDWNNASLTLSTVTVDKAAKGLPELAPIKIMLQSNQPLRDRDIVNRRRGTTVTANTYSLTQQRLKAQMTGALLPEIHSRHSSQLRSGNPKSGTNPFALQSSSMPFEAEIETEDFEDVEESELEQVAITEPTTVVTETPIAISYSVQGKTTIPSDGIEHQVSVAVLPFESKISYVAVPRIEPRVYLQCEVKNTSEYRFLPGPVGVILDDSHASNTFLGDVNIGDNFECTLGDDTATSITYLHTSRSTKIDGGSFSEGKKMVTYDTQITIHNKHAFTIPDLVVRDVIPTSDDEHAKVILRKPAGLAQAKAGEVVADSEKEGMQIMWSKEVDGKGGEKEGKFEWKCSIGAGEKVTLESQWEIKVPADSILAQTLA